jgi:hypothetical protein
MQLPDARGWAAIGLFAMAIFELLALALHPQLGAVDLFKTLSQGTFTGGLLLVASYYFGSSHKDRPPQ